MKRLLALILVALFLLSFAACGASVPETMDELVAVCEAIKNIDPRIIPLGIDSASNLYLNLLAQSTGEASPDLASAPETLKMLRELYTKGWVTTADIEEQYSIKREHERLKQERADRLRMRNGMDGGSGNASIFSHRTGSSINIGSNSSSFFANTFAIGLCTLP